MPCEPIKRLPKGWVVDLETELEYRYTRLRLLNNDDENDPYLKGFKEALQVVKQHNNAISNANT